MIERGIGEILKKVQEIALSILIFFVALQEREGREEGGEGVSLGEGYGSVERGVEVDSVNKKANKLY